MSAVCPTVARACTAPNWISLANTCASGRNSSTEALELNSSGVDPTTVRTSVSTLRWVSRQP